MCLSHHQLPILALGLAAAKGRPRESRRSRQGVRQQSSNWGRGRLARGFSPGPVGLLPPHTERERKVSGVLARRKSPQLYCGLTRRRRTGHRSAARHGRPGKERLTTAEAATQGESAEAGSLRCTPVFAVVTSRMVAFRTIGTRRRRDTSAIPVQSPIIPDGSTQESAARKFARAGESGTLDQLTELEIDSDEGFRERIDRRAEPATD